MSKLVSNEELGQTNSLFGICEALTPLLCGPLYSFVYNRTISRFPGAFFLVSGLFHIVAFFIFLWIYSIHRAEWRKKETIDDIQVKSPEKMVSTGAYSYKHHLSRNSADKDDVVREKTKNGIVNVGFTNDSNV